jgi:hypothetical protein
MAALWLAQSSTKLGLQPQPFGEACYAFWQGGDFDKNDEPQGNQVVKAVRACVKETGASKLFSADIMLTIQLR